MRNQRLAYIVRLSDHDTEQARRRLRHLRNHLAYEIVARNGTERRLFRRFPYDRIAAHEGEHCIPCPDGDWEVKCSDDAHRAEGMPLLHHAMGGPLGGDGVAVKLPGEAD